MRTYASILLAMVVCAVSLYGGESPSAPKASAREMAPPSVGGDLDAIRARGVLRHLGIPYANFVTGAGDGLDVEIMQRFAAHLGVRYVYVPSAWDRVIPELVGYDFAVVDGVAKRGASRPIRGDIIASGLTELPWRKTVMAYSKPVFPTQVWLLARKDSELVPIRPSGDEAKDIAATKAMLKGKTVLVKSGTCLAPEMYDVVGCGGKPRDFPGSLNDLAPALLKQDAELLLLDVPDCLVAFRKWPGKVKVLGPISAAQFMGCAFRQDAPALRAAFDRFLDEIRRDGTYYVLVSTYYPDVPGYFPNFFRDVQRKEPATPGETVKEADTAKDGPAPVSAKE